MACVAAKVDNIANNSRGTNTLTYVFHAIPDFSLGIELDAPLLDPIDKIQRSYRIIAGDLKGDTRQVFLSGRSVLGFTHDEAWPPTSRTRWRID